MSEWQKFYKHVDRDDETKDEWEQRPLVSLAHRYSREKELEELAAENEILKSKASEVTKLRAANAELLDFTNHIAMVDKGRTSHFMTDSESLLHYQIMAKHLMKKHGGEK